MRLRQLDRKSNPMGQICWLGVHLKPIRQMRKSNKYVNKKFIGHRDLKIPWLKHGDRNKKFFHQKTSQRRCRNYIQRIRDADINWAENVKDIAGVALDYFQKMLTAGECDQMDDCLSVVPHKISAEMYQTLTSEFSVDEIKAALFQMAPTKALGLDGVNAFFFPQKY